MAFTAARWRRSTSARSRSRVRSCPHRRCDHQWAADPGGRTVAGSCEVDFRAHESFVTISDYVILNNAAFDRCRHLHRRIAPHLLRHDGQLLPLRGTRHRCAQTASEMIRVAGSTRRPSAHGDDHQDSTIHGQQHDLQQWQDGRSGGWHQIMLNSIGLQQLACPCRPLQGSHRQRSRSGLGAWPTSHD